MFAIVHLLATFIASASFFIAFSSPAEGLVFIANMALIQASAQRTLNITIAHFVKALQVLCPEASLALLSFPDSGLSAHA